MDEFDLRAIAALLIEEPEADLVVELLPRLPLRGDPYEGRLYAAATGVVGDAVVVIAAAEVLAVAVANGEPTSEEE